MNILLHACATGAALLLALAAMLWLHERGAFDAMARFLPRSMVEGLLLATVVVGLIHYGATKETNGVRGASAPMRSEPSAPRILTQQEIDAGYALVGVGTNETFDFSPSPGAVVLVHEDWDEYPRKSFANEWYKCFEEDAGDDRQLLTWGGRFADVEFKVVDDDGRPVHGANVNVFFDMADRSKGKRVIAQTDTNGICALEEKTMGVLEIEVSREGYYRTVDEISYISMGREHEVKGGNWQPWGMCRQIILLPVKNPVARIVESPDWKWTKELYKWIGFDLIKYDFVKPFGVDEHSDMEVMFEWDGKWKQEEYNGMALHIRFPAKFSGGYYADKTPGSEYIGIYQADTNGIYNANFTYSEWVSSRNKRGYATGYERRSFDLSKVLVVRSRCTLNEDGSLKTAHYFQLHGIKFSGDNKKGVALKFLSIYNPTPNDTNLEPKR